uniref:Putative secreted peptide n=1 Tax=Anopheles braziliensis TaxID=58242 RepID=A0A2M3ZWM7_9DIPT
MRTRCCVVTSGAFANAPRALCECNDGDADSPGADPSVICILKQIPIPVFRRRSFRLSRWPPEEWRTLLLAGCWRCCYKSESELWAV